MQVPKIFLEIKLQNYLFTSASSIDVTVDVKALSLSVCVHFLECYLKSNLAYTKNYQFVLVVFFSKIFAHATQFGNKSL